MRTFFAILLFSLFAFPFQSQAWQQDSLSAKPLVFKMDIKAQIDPPMTRYVELALEEAHEMKADYIVIEMDTYGGMVTDADNISSLLLREEIPVYVFINVDAASAGAMISISCDSIYMAPGASIGAATVVNGEDGAAAPDKYQSYMRKKMRSAAEATGRNPDIAEGMVDEDIEVEGVIAAGKVITFSTTEAIQFGYCEAQVKSIDEVMARSGVTDYTLHQFELPGVESIIAFFINPFVNGILILIIIGGIYFELQTPGVGFPIIASVIALILFLTPYYLHGLAESWEIILFFLGVGLLFIEIFVIPGFGVAGISGIILMLGSLVLIMLNNDVFDFSLIPMGNIVRAITTTAVGFVGALVFMLVMGASLVNTVLFKRVALVETQKRTEGFTSSYNANDLVGKLAEAYTILRPSGKILLDDEIKDAYTRGEYIDKGEKVKILSTEGTSLRVRKAKEEELEEDKATEA